MIYSIIYGVIMQDARRKNHGDDEDSLREGATRQPHENIQEREHPQNCHLERSEAESRDLKPAMAAKRSLHSLRSVEMTGWALSNMGFSGVRTVTVEGAKAPLAVRGRIW